MEGQPKSERKGAGRAKEKQSIAQEAREVEKRRFFFNGSLMELRSAKRRNFEEDLCVCHKGKKNKSREREREIF